MRHKVAGNQLSRDNEHRLAMRRNMTASLIEHETIATTPAKAKEVKRFAERMISLAKKGTLGARRRAISEMGGDRNIVVQEEGKTVKKNTVIGKLFSEIGPRYLDRPGGYTRIIRLSMNRLGDNGRRVLLQLIGENETIQPKEKKEPQAQPEEASETQQQEQPEQQTETEAKEQPSQDQESQEESGQEESSEEDEQK